MLQQKSIEPQCYNRLTKEGIYWREQGLIGTGYRFDCKEFRLRFWVKLQP